MKQTEDHLTLDMLGDLPRRRGRPAGRIAPMSASQRKQLQRQRLREEGRASVTVTLPVEVIEALDAFLRFKDETKDSVVERVLRDRLMRKR